MTKKKKRKQIGTCTINFRIIRDTRLIKMNENNYKVYMHTCPNGKKYVGITKQNVKDRWQNGKETKEVVETKRTVEPNLIAVNVILDNYENEGKLKPLIEELKEIKRDLED